MEPLGVPVRIMVSSTRADLGEYRQEAAEVIESLRGDFERDLQVIDVSMERQLQSGLPEGPAAVSQRWVEESDWVVLIVGWNYGSLSAEPGTEGLGFTEIEYRHARDLHKRVFMFMSADKAGAGEPPHDSDAAHQQLLDRFRDDLKGRFFLAQFADRKDFRNVLRRTLRQALQDERDRRRLAHLGQLGDIIKAVGPDLRDFAAKVEQIRNCKLVHDCLHSHLQRGIRTLREQVLSSWRDRRELSDENFELLLQTLGTLRECNGGLAAELKRLVESLTEPGGPLQHSVEVVVAPHEALWQAQYRRPHDLDAFSQLVEDFATQIRVAFRSADDRIRREVRAMDQLYKALVNAVWHAEGRQPLGRTEHAKLARHLDRIDEASKCLSRALEEHHGWQEAHDLIERHAALPTDPAKEWPGTVARLLELVRDESRRQQDDPDAYARFAREKGLSGPPDLQALECALRDEQSGQTDHGPPADFFRNFYDAFWIVDKRTLEELEAAKTRVDAFVTQLQDLERERMHAAPVAGGRP
jgi:hypothetical protein